MKGVFHYFLKGLSVAKNCHRTESAPLKKLLVAIDAYHLLSD